MNATDLKKHPSFGSFAAIALACGLSREAVRKWRLVPLNHCAAIERASKGTVSCETLRGDVVWHRDRQRNVTGYTTPALGAAKAN